MTKTCLIRKVGSIAFCISFSTLLLQANQVLNLAPYTESSKETDANPIQSFVPMPHAFKKRGDTPYTRVRKRLFPIKEHQWLFLQPKRTQQNDQPLETVHYQAEDAIIFDARNNQLLLQGTSVLEYDTMKLEAARIALNLSARTITAEGTKDTHDQWVGSPIFTFKDKKKGKYGQAGTTTTRTFFMEKIRYNIDTKRALATKLTTKQEESIIQTEQTKKEDEETFYAKDLRYTTCGLHNPHFYIRTKQAKMVQDQHITSGPFRFYFDDVPTPLGFFFGALFLEGKRTHGIIPPEIGEDGGNGFYLRNGGYYIHFNDYADLSMIGSIYSNGITELKNELRYKKRYLCSGNIGYNQNRGKKEKGWALSWSHTTLSHRTRSLNAQVNLRNKGYRTFDKETTELSKKTTNQSSGSLTYKDKLVGLPYQLTLRTKYEKNLRSNFTHWTLPEGTLHASWYPFKRGVQKEQWFQKLQVKHTIDFQNHFKNAVQDPTSTISMKKEEVPQVPTTAAWNRYTENGVLHTLPCSLETKLFEYLNATPNFTYSEAWYWKKLCFEADEPEPMHVPGFHRVYSWSTGGTLHTTLYHTRYFSEDKYIQGLRITTTPSATITYTPDFSSKEYGFFQEVTNEKGEKEKKYAFQGFLPQKTLTNRATLVLDCKLQNGVELKVQNKIDEPSKEQKQKQKNDRKIFLFKHLDVGAKYDFKAEKCHFTEGINLHIASEAKIGKIGKMDFDWTTNFDPYLSEVTTLDNGNCKEEPIQAFAWDNGKYLGKIKTSRVKIGMQLEAAQNAQEKSAKKKALLDNNNLLSKLEEKQHKIDFETAWSIGGEFNWIYDRLYEYKPGEPNHKKEQYVTFNGSMTLVKKWKLSGRSSYNFTKKKLDPSTTEISIQRDLHCWQLSYQWYPLGDQAKYDFYLGVKANVLKALKLPRKRSYNKLTTSPTNSLY